ncbi:MAG: T9SS type A sorting domain-containing protein, partial [Bacteroidetes bacterium]
GVSASYTVNSSTDISATVPNTATTGVVTVTTPSGSNSSSSSFVVQATIVSFTPSSGIPGTTVTISGYAFTGASVVAFNGTNASFTVDSYSQITATVPAGATTGVITVTTAAGTATSATNFDLLPNITSFSPTSGVIGDVVTILGTNFTGATDVSFNGTSAAIYTVVSSTQIDAEVPAGATTGLIAVTTPDGTDNSATNFSVEPNVTSLTPSSGEVGDVITIGGTAFTGATSVTFNGVSASYTVNSSTDISATVPNTATTGLVTVTTPSGSNSSSTNFSVQPTILSFVPTSGTPGASVVITGYAFTGATSVEFNGAAASFTVNSYSQITATVPATATTGVITVTTPAGTATSATNFTLDPNITSFSPTSGIIGDVISIFGTSFTGATDVSFNGTSAVTFTVVSATQIDATVPAGATTGLISVTTPDGTDFSATNFSVLPDVQSFAPTTEQVGQSVTITGASFTGATSVTFNGTSASFTVDNDAQITATVPNNTTDGVIVVTTPSGSGTSLTTFGIEPDVTGFAPASGIAGTSVVITGTGFDGITQVLFNAVNASYTVNSYTQITATVPASASTGQIVVVNGNGNDPSTANFLVPPTITGLSASSGIIGSTVTITGTTFVGVTNVAFNGVSAVSYTVVSATQIDADVPAGATTGSVTVTTAGGTGTSGTTFTVLPNITSFTNSPGPVGTSVVISGTAFTGASAVTFNGVSASYTVNSSTQITATVPNGALTGAIQVTTAAGTATSATNYVVTPSVSSFTPTSGTIGSSVTINGQAFTGVTGVTFNGVSASFTFVSNTQVTATVPAGATTGAIAVTTPSGTGTSGTNYSVLPGISNFSPTSGIIGSTVTITGTAFTGATAVTFNGVSAVAFTVVSSTQIDATVPAGSTTGLISVTTPSGTSNSSTSFTVLPNISSFTNSPGPVGTSVVITGSAFTGASAVTFNGVSSSYTVNSSTQITATVPSGATTGAIAVTTAAGTATSATNYVVTPSITSFSPGSGGVGTTVTINGQAFTGVTNVAFNGTNATFTFVSNTQVTATVPNGATTGTIAITTPSGTGTSVGSFTVTATISSFTPTSGVIGTGSIIVTGTAFTGATAFRFNGTNSVFTVDSYSQITATVPAGATTGLLSVVTPAGTSNSSTNFTVPPNITGFSSSTGTVGASRTINGTAFTGATSVTFNGVSASYTVSSSTAITATVPSGATTGPVAVTTPSGTATSGTSFTVTPTVSGFSPTSGAVGASVTINGEAFTGATSVTFNGISAAFTVVSNTQITATVPATATTGTIQVTTPSGSGTSGSNFSVLPAISNFTPTSGTIGSSVTINGTTFTGATAVRVNGVNAAAFTVISSTQIDFTVGNSSTTGLVSVTTAAGTASSSTNFTVLPNITGFSAGSGVVGTGITINGSAFTGASSVKFNGVSAAFTVASSTSITTTVPSGATTGFVTVTTAAGTATSGSMFTVPPSIASFGPGSGVVGDSITITGEAFTGATNVSFNGTSAGFLVYSATSIKAAVPAGATDGFITVTTPSGSASSNPTSFDVLPKLAVLNELNVMLVVDSKGFEQRLYFGKVSEANVALASKYELRPVQQGMFDIRFAPSSKESNGRLVELFSSVQKNRQYRVTVAAATYPLTIHFDKGTKQLSVIRVSSLVDGKPVNTVELTKSKSFTIEEANANELLIEIGDEISLPTEFALRQNYPNPFNPATTIRYELPGTYWVSLKIYNMIGEEVADVINGEKEQGSYEINWNAADQPSGVYIYRLTVMDATNRSKEAFVEVRKMLLIK